MVSIITRPGGPIHNALASMDTQCKCLNLMFTGSSVASPQQNFERHLPKGRGIHIRSELPHPWGLASLVPSHPSKTTQFILLPSVLCFNGKLVLVVVCDHFVKLPKCQFLAPYSIEVRCFPALFGGCRRGFCALAPALSYTCVISSDFE